MNVEHWKKEVVRLVSRVTFFDQDNGYKPECIIVSNRGPIEDPAALSGDSHSRNSPGGVVTGLMGAIQHHKVIWISLSPGQQAAPLYTFGQHSLLTPLNNILLYIEHIPQNIYHLYYNCISNHILWFAQHSLLQPMGSTTFDNQTRVDWEQGYVKVNTILAKAVIDQLNHSGSTVPVIFQDYHLYLLPAKVREQCSHARLSHIVSEPWPNAQYLALLPAYMGEAIYQSLAANDIIGFQTRRDAQNFLLGAEYFLKARIHWNYENPVGTFDWQNRHVQVRLCPISIAPRYIQTIVESKEAEAVIDALSLKIPFNGKQQFILRIDRMEPTKNILRGFQAYEHLLRLHSELQGKVVFLALLVPSRQDLPEYRFYEREIRHTIEVINARYGLGQWQPIIALFGNDRIRALACLQYYDVLLVNSIMDGMNLTVKEGASVNRRSGVIVLSRTAGAYDTLGEHVLSITPLDVDETAAALYRALVMPLDERLARASNLRRIVQDEDAEKSLDVQIEALLQIK